MEIRHKVFFVFWSFVTAVAMTNDNLRREYCDYAERCWATKAAAQDDRQWLHRRWFPKKYGYENPRAK